MDTEDPALILIEALGEVLEEILGEDTALAATLLELDALIDALAISVMLALALEDMLREKLGLTIEALGERSARDALLDTESDAEVVLEEENSALREELADIEEEALRDAEGVGTRGEGLALALGDGDDDEDVEDRVLEALPACIDCDG